ncbi:beta-lactoglobulin-1-like [Erinaceus europaeus]|uniref:Beta-lactoglobulin-1-like n=1 Tax=Erinaceus europaeus TaxID=9365 RepID=A0ABM3Y1R9_ERIEU|nr:beta-lactoglobulin-1-like [Erinaceus europaeus]
MKCVLLALALVCAVQAIDVPQPMKDVDIQKLPGKWYTVAMAANNIALLDAKNTHLKVFVKALALTPENNLEITLSEWEDNKCVEKAILAEKTSNPAYYSINYAKENQVVVVSKDQKEVSLCMENTTAPEKSLVCLFLAKDPNTKDKVMGKFVSVLEDLSVQPQILLDLTQADEPCRI